MFIIVFASCCILNTQAQAQQQQKPLPLQTNDPINDGIYVQSITLPSSVTTDDDDDERSTNESSDTNRERLIMYDFKPAFPPYYTKESLDKLLIIPHKDDNNNVDVDVEESPLVEEEMDDDDDIDDGLVIDEKINSDEVIDKEVVHREDDVLHTYEEDISQEDLQQHSNSNESSDEVKVVDDTIGNDEVIEQDEDISSTESSDTNGKKNEATEIAEIQQQDKLDSDETNSLLEDVKDDSNNDTVVEEETNKSDTVKDDDDIDNDINVPPQLVLSRPMFCAH